MKAKKIITSFNVILAVGLMLLLGYGMCQWWLTTQNNLFNNGRWISGKDTGKFLFYSFQFLFRPIDKSFLNLSSDMGFHEVIYRRPEGAQRELMQLELKSKIDKNAYLWILLRKNAERLQGIRLSNHPSYLSGFYQYDDKGDLEKHIVFDVTINQNKETWHGIQIHIEKQNLFLMVDDQQIFQTELMGGSSGFFGFKGSGNPRRPVLIKDVMMQFRDPQNPESTWSEYEDFTKINMTIWQGVLFFGLSAIILLLRYVKQCLFASMIHVSYRAYYIAVDSVILFLMLLFLLFLPKYPSGVQFFLLLILSECISFILIGLLCRKYPNKNWSFSYLLASCYVALMLLVVGWNAFKFESLNQQQDVVPKHLTYVKPEAIKTYPSLSSSTAPLSLPNPIIVRPGEPFFSEGRAYRDQHISVEFIMCSNCTMDVVYQQQSFQTLGDDEGEVLPYLRHLIRLSTLPDVPAGISLTTGNRPAPFKELEGVLRPGMLNTLYIQSIGSKTRVHLNGVLTETKELTPLNFGEFGIMVFEESVSITGLHVESASNVLLKNTYKPILIGFCPLLIGFVLLVFMQWGRKVNVLKILLFEWISFYPWLVYSMGSMMATLGTTSLFKSMILWKELSLIAVLLNHLFLFLMLRRDVRFASVLFNMGFILLTISFLRFVWDLLPPEHSWKLHFTDSTQAPSSYNAKNSYEGPWYAHNKMIGANIFHWNQAFGGERISIQNVNKKIRIFVMGGSQAWGSGAASTSTTFAELLEKQLNAKNLNTEVFNASVNGIGIRKVVHYFKQIVIPFNPDVIILDIGLNDCASLALRKKEARKIARTQSLIKHFEAFLNLCQASEIEVLLCLEPMCAELGLRPYEPYYEALEKTAKSYGVHVVNPFLLTTRMEKDHFVWWDTAHLAPRGQRLLADQIQPGLEEIIKGL